MSEGSSAAKQFAGAEPKFFTVGNKGINTQVPRESIEDDEFSWLENIQPIGEGNRRTLYDKGTAIYTATGGLTIVYACMYNLGTTSGTTYAGIFLSDGSAVQVLTVSPFTVTQIGPAATFYPTLTLLGTPLPAACQYGQQYLIITSTPVVASGTSTIGNGYWIWDGALLYGAGTLAPIVTVTTGGAGYSTAPTITISGGQGNGATLVATVTSGSVTQVTVTNPGSGYVNGDTPILTFSAGAGGSGALLTAVMSSAAGGSGASLTLTLVQAADAISVQSPVTINSGGSNYSNAATINVAGGNPFTQAVLTPVLTSGVVTGVTIVNAGYYKSLTPVPTATVVDPSGGNFRVTSVIVSASGTGYSPSTVISVTTGSASVTTQAVITPVLTSGRITGTVIQNAGLYSTSTPPLLAAVDTATTAGATVMLMPFGIAGTCIETYQTRVWIGNGSKLFFSSPGTLAVQDFRTSTGAGALTSNDPFLRREICSLKQVNGFLYYFADSSINVISNVQSSGSPILTTLNNQNVDPQTGTPWHNSVVAFGNKLLFTNINGVFQLEGGSAGKISDQLDGIFLAAKSGLTGVSSVAQPTGAAMVLNDVLVYMALVPVQGPFDNSSRNALVIWDGKKWFLGSQSVALTFVCTQEIDSILQAWGTDNTHFFPLFNTANTSLTKTYQTKLWSKPYIMTKQALRLYTMGYNNESSAYVLTGTLDYILENANLQQASFTVTSRAAVGPTLQGIGLTNISARGNYLGLTVQSTSQDFTLIDQTLLYRDDSPLGG